MTLALVFLPMLIWPVPSLVAHGWWWLLGIGAAAAIVAFVALLPRADAGWVIYHVTETEAHAIIRHAARRLGWVVRPDDAGATLPDAELRLDCTAFPWLGSVSIHLRGMAGRPDPALLHDLRLQIERQLERRSLLPSVVGTCLVVVGVVLWIVPLWMAFRHMDAIVDVVQSFLFA